jgi:hypothetical protein
MSKSTETNLFCQRPRWPRSTRSNRCNTRRSRPSAIRHLLPVACYWLFAIRYAYYGLRNPLLYSFSGIRVSELTAQTEKLREQVLVTRCCRTRYEAWR